MATEIKTSRELAQLPYANRTVTEKPGGRGGRGGPGRDGARGGPPPRPDAPPRPPSPAGPAAASPDASADDVVDELLGGGGEQ